MKNMDAIPEGYRYQTAEVEALRELVGQNPQQFSLNLAICDDTSLRSLIVQQMQAAHPDVEVIALWPYERDVFEHVHAASSRAPKDALFIAGLDDALSANIDRQALLTGLNESATRWKNWFACPVVFWVDVHTADILRTHARDFWEWQNGIYRLDG
jgi:hypothetical protein